MQCKYSIWFLNFRFFLVFSADTSPSTDKVFEIYIKFTKKHDCDRLSICLSINVSVANNQDEFYLKILFGWPSLRVRSHPIIILFNLETRNTCSTKFLTWRIHNIIHSKAKSNERSRRNETESEFITCKRSCMVCMKVLL